MISDVPEAIQGCAEFQVCSVRFSSGAMSQDVATQLLDSKSQTSGYCSDTKSQSTLTNSNPPTPLCKSKLNHRRIKGKAKIMRKAGKSVSLREDCTTELPVGLDQTLVIESIEAMLKKEHEASSPGVGKDDFSELSLPEKRMLLAQLKSRVFLIESIIKSARSALEQLTKFM